MNESCFCISKIYLAPVKISLISQIQRHLSYSQKYLYILREIFVALFE